MRFIYLLFLSNFIILSSQDIDNIIRSHVNDVKELAPFRVSYKNAYLDKDVFNKGKISKFIYYSDLLALKDGRFISSSIREIDGKRSPKSVIAWTGEAYYNNSWRLDKADIKPEFFILNNGDKIIRKSPAPMDIVGLGATGGKSYNYYNVAFSCVYLSIYDYMNMKDSFFTDFDKRKRTCLRWCDIVDESLLKATIEKLSLEVKEKNKYTIKLNTPKTYSDNIVYFMEEKDNRIRCNSMLRKFHSTFKKETIFGYSKEMANGVLPSNVSIKIYNKDKKDGVFKVTSESFREMTSFEKLSEEDAEEAIALFPLSLKGTNNANWWKTKQEKNKK